jgi:hypothetical protein
VSWEATAYTGALTDRFVKAPVYSVASQDTLDCHDITEILLKVALNTIKQSNRHMIGQSKMNKRLPNIT